jgi:hypothetical protein
MARSARRCRPTFPGTRAVGGNDRSVWHLGQGRELHFMWGRNGQTSPRTSLRSENVTIRQHRGARSRLCPIDACRRMIAGCAEGLVPSLSRGSLVAYRPIRKVQVGAEGALACSQRLRSSWSRWRGWRRAKSVARGGDRDAGGIGDHHRVFGLWPSSRRRRCLRLAANRVISESTAASLKLDCGPLPGRVRAAKAVISRGKITLQCLLNVVRGGKTPDLDLREAETMGTSSRSCPVF